MQDPERFEFEVEPEIELKLQDKETGYQLSSVRLGDMFQLNGVHFKVVKINQLEGGQSNIVLEPQGYTSKRLKRFKRDMEKRAKGK